MHISCKIYKILACILAKFSVIEFELNNTIQKANFGQSSYKYKIVCNKNSLNKMSVNLKIHIFILNG